LRPGLLTPPPLLLLLLDPPEDDEEEDGELRDELLSEGGGEYVLVGLSLDCGRLYEPLSLSFLKTFLIELPSEGLLVFGVLIEEFEFVLL
jgi:hypothetical protein